uniref:Variant surface glycoprotein 1943 n=1 Tax=Trypanosoma brucei TaxID=5691 RepID=M4SXP4_9TRYP|nr:variant surface glycoprotein 1943 [Trypanosoma brucei]
MAISKLPMLTISVVIAALEPAQAAAGDGKYLKEFHVLCKLVQIAQAGVERLAITPLATSSIEFIEVLNMSSSQTSWKDKFTGEGNKSPAKEPDCSGADKPLECDPEFKTWQMRGKTLKTLAEAPATKKQHTLGDGIESSAHGKRVQQMLGHIATLARRVKASTDQETATYQAQAIQDLKHELKQALYGTQEKTDDDGGVHRQMDAHRYED